MSPHPSDHAVVVGINEYPHLRTLKGAVNDACFFYQWLIEPDGGGLDYQNVRLFVDPQSNLPEWIDKNAVTPPTRDAISGVLIKLIEHRALNAKPAGRRLYLFFAGHGVTPWMDRNEVALLMSNAHALALDRHVPGRGPADAIRYNEVFKEIVLFMDCCRDHSLNCPMNPFGFQMLVERGLRQEARRCYAFATRWSHQAREAELPIPYGEGTAAQGRFTHALLEGLRTARRADGVIDARSLERFVTERTLALAGQINYQKPEFNTDEGISFGRSRSVRVLVSIPEGFRLWVEDGHLQNVEVTLTNGSDGLEFKLPAGLYRFSLISKQDSTDVRRELREVVGEVIDVF